MNGTRKPVLALGAILALGAWLAGPVRAANLSAELDLQVTFNANLSVAVNGIEGSTETLYGYNAGGVDLSANGPGASDYAAPKESATVTNNGGTTERWQLSVSTIGAGGANWTLNNATGTSHANSSGVSVVTGHYGCTGNCPGAEQYGFQALFVSSATKGGGYGTASACPAVTASDWDVVVTTVPDQTGFAPAAGQLAGVATYLGAAAVRQFADAAPIAGPNGLPDSDVTGVTPAVPPAGVPNTGDMLPTADSGVGGNPVGVGTRGLCVRMTMPLTTTTLTQQMIRLLITAIAG